MEQPSYLAIDHIAYATRSTEKTSAFFTALGFEVLFHKQPIEKFGVLITKLRSPAGEIVEVVEPFRPDSVVSRLLVNVEACIYHAAFRVRDIQTTQTSLASIGGVSVTKPMTIPYPATEEHRSLTTSHMFHPAVGLFEITG
ncbi:coronamic acid synthetase [Pseudomonas syringae pv. tomato]|uniref:Coronamic acid synthetase n=10 Tax=Pseudomonas syringae group TaxID=136849 RepID=A0A2K4X415_PSESX|nr:MULTISPECIES: coronamic acid synthetase CmaC [Pseudomonas syringae group]AAQ93486.1 CmaC [Pseudomonas savastanoi pv. glycinea]AVB17590.1 coronamic acid synthetase [Pseudomonas amygdali pv. morsprunorum]AVI87956.1 coronamic acid synthetase [Pseudomonas syringae pv. tomato]EFW77582.1 coronamic acid synthetase CmaC [Pseudomonas savastanoi pv. glycinea str. B076]EGH04400.1 coronamic acid synthetase CmaC [Pseudomonas amygdali pv. aesculi str. 0893_23]